MAPQATLAPVEAPIETLPPVNTGANAHLPPVDAGATPILEPLGQEQSGAAASSQASTRPASVPARQRSRSPRDSSVRAASAAGDDAQPEQKKSKVDGASDASLGISEFLGPQHFEGIANQMAEQLKTMGVQAGTPPLPVQAGNA